MGAIEMQSFLSFQLIYFTTNMPGCLCNRRQVSTLFPIRSLRFVTLLCMAAVVFLVVTLYLPGEYVNHRSVKAHFWRNRSHSEASGESHKNIQGWKDRSYVVANGSDFLINPGSVWPVSDQFGDRIMSQLEVLRAYAQTTKNITSTTKVILRVGTFNFNHLNWHDGRQHLVDDRCPITNCLFTSNQSLSSSADAVVISEFDWNDVGRLTPKAAHQVWVSLFMEPPHQRPLNSRALGGLANWTMSYRPDSTIVTPYGKWIPVSISSYAQESGSRYENRHRDCSNCSSRMSVNCSNWNRSQRFQPNCMNCSSVNCTRQAVNYAKGRTKKVAMFVSNWKDRNGRRRYAWELGKYIAVDLYGDCPHSLPCRKSEAKRCHDMLKRDYKFYLAFENSNCVGYITEKLHKNAMRNDIVPIVMGARVEDYAMAAPPGSYIHVEDFRSPRHLADYLNVLDANDTLYNEYFRYKDHFRYLDVLETRYWCRLCGLLHLRDHVNYVNWYEDFDGRTMAACSRFQDGRKPWRTWRKGNTETSSSKDLVEILLGMFK